MSRSDLDGLCKRVAVTQEQLWYLLEQIELHIPKSEVWVFGSRVKFSHRAASDLDLAVCCDKETAKWVLPKLGEVFEESDLPYKVQLLDFNRLPENMQDNIRAGYVVLYPLGK